MPFPEIKQCRLCQSQNVKTILDFGLSPLANKYFDIGDYDETVESPIRYFQCQQCLSVQLQDEVPSEILFADYDYESPPNLGPNFSNLVKTAGEVLNWDPATTMIVDIGANSGLLLSKFREAGYKHLMGIEPCAKLANKIAEKGIGVYRSFFNDVAVDVIESTRAVMNPSLRLGIVSTNTFAHVPDLNGFVANLSRLMGEHDSFIFENAYLLNTLQNTDLGQLYAEHIFLHSVAPLVQFFKKHDLCFWRVENIPVQMGSIRGFVLPDALRQCTSSVINAISLEIEQGLDEPATYEAFTQRTIKMKERLLAQIKGIKKDPANSIAIMGWPAKCTLLNKFVGLEPFIDFVVDESPLKIGKLAPGTKLHIKSLDYFRNNPTTHCIIGAYNFAEDIKMKNDWFKGEWIVPL